MNLIKTLYTDPKERGDIMKYSKKELNNKKALYSKDVIDECLECVE